MRPIFICLVFSLLVSCAFSQQSDSASKTALPRLIRFAGVLKDPSGTPLTGIAGITFSLYAQQEGGVPLWLETQNVVLDANGNYEILLGAEHSSGVPMDLFTTGEARWLGIQVQGQTAEQPRVLLVSVPYALKAADAETVGGLPPSAFVLAMPSNSTAGTSAASASGVSASTTLLNLAGSGTLDFLPLWTPDGNTLGNSVLFQSGIGSTAKIGVNTTTPGTTLDVKGGTIVRGTLTLPSTGTATSTAGKNSQPEKMTASAYNSSTKAAVNQTFQWQAEPAGNNTSAPSGTLNLLFGSGSSTPTETGLHIANNGQISFASGQVFPGTGPGTVTSVGLTAPTSDFTVSGSPVTSSGTLNLAWKVAPTSANTANAIVKRDSSGNFSANTISGVSANFSSAISANGGFLNYYTLVQSLDTINPQLQVTQLASSDYSRLRLNLNGLPFWDIAAGGSSNVLNFYSSAIGANVMSLGSAGSIGIGTSTPDNEGQQLTVLAAPQELQDAIYAQGGSTPIGGGNSGDGLIAVGGSANSGFGGLGIFAEGGCVTGNCESAGAFAGDVVVTGTLTSGVKDFLIDHPLDPANKYLYHSSVESSEMKNIYDGTITLDAQGEALVQLPNWFEALNRDFRYQLTAIGTSSPGLYVAQKISGNQFRIAGGTPGAEVSWQVTGIRHDAYAEANPLTVEKLKEARERGYYLHPKLFGAPEEKGVEWARRPKLMKRIKEIRAKQLAATARK